MAYSRNFNNSAIRHLEAADHLEQAPPPNGRPDVAGYIYGVAAECALKEIMFTSGMRELATDRRRDDPYYAHFPTLKTLLRDQASGRRQSVLKRYSSDVKFMEEWSTEMRYAPSRDVPACQITLWKGQARKLVDEMNSWA
jgi:hypothetical protein